MDKTSAQYQDHKRRARERQQRLSTSGRELGPLPPVVNPARKSRGLTDLEFWLRTYLPATFYLPFSPDHTKAIERLTHAVIHGGLFALAMPRGSGKTSMCEGAAMWAMLAGHRHFVQLVGADEGAAEDMLESIKTEIETSQLLLEDYPEVVFPVQALEGIHQRAAGQTYQGVRTGMDWTAKQVVLPTIRGSQASGAILRVAGITGKIRGAKFKDQKGNTLRPDLALLDDPQTDASAASLDQCEKRERIIGSAVLGLAGPRKKIAGMCCCTVIQPDDLACRLLDHTLHPEWQGQLTRLCYSEPTDSARWEEYAELRRRGHDAGDGGKLATDYYRQHREAMDKGAVVAWPERFNEDELSAVQYVMNLKIDNPIAYASEYQNDPVPILKTLGAITRDQVLGKLNGLRRNTVPAGAEYVTAFIDVHDTVLYWAACGWLPNFTGGPVDYGVYPQQGKAYFSLREATRTLQKAAGPDTSKQAAILAGLVHVGTELLTRTFRRDDGMAIPVGRLLIDCGYLPRVVEQAVLALDKVRPGIAVCSRGHSIKASDKPMVEWQHKRSDRRGHYWGLFIQKTHRHRVVLADVNYWKSRVRDGYATPVTDPGAVGLFGNDPGKHRLWADHMAAEFPVETQGRGRRVEEWKQRPGQDNHWLDCLVGCAVGASMLGAKASTVIDTAAPARKRVKLSEMQRQRRIA